MNIKQLDSPEIAQALRAGKIVVMPTDTIYGLHASAFNEKSVEKIYTLKGRDAKKPFIVLISSFTDLKVFQIKLSPQVEEFLGKIWPGKVSVVIPCDNPIFEHLHRGYKSIAFRVPNRHDLISLLKVTGPLVSTSVNTQGNPAAKTIEEAESYFRDKIDMYINEGPMESEPSTVIEIEGNKVKVLRQGAVKIK